MRLAARVMVHGRRIIGLKHFKRKCARAKRPYLLGRSDITEDARNFRSATLKRCKHPVIPVVKVTPAVEAHHVHKGKRYPHAELKQTGLACHGAKIEGLEVKSTRLN
jgi:hypothetical protein